MTKTRTLRRFVSALILLLLPGAALAEVSVVVHPRTGRVIKVLTLGGVRADGSQLVWSQVRSGVPLHHMLNPLGDTLQDLAPTIRTHPASGSPWVVWPARHANITRIVVSRWDGTGWSPRQPVVADPGPFYVDEVNPDLVFDAAGQPFLVWEREGSIGSIQFSTLSDGGWTRPLRLSEEGVDSRFPAISVEGQTATVRYLTPGGWVTTTYETAVMVEAANGNLMDTPIPPGNTSGDTGGSGGGGEDKNFLKVR